ncbi:MAG: ABC transporter permease [Oscillospiraceae bacterium]|jgi:ribose/xylose/arabinose/galactoside ABC-type transport system permease subunit|nr:ABC transporter permease [Oscillospiraceae bacterium]
MRKTSTIKRLLRDKSAPLLAILIVLMIATMVISSGVLKGAPFSALFTKGFLSKGNLVGIFNNLVIRMVFLCGIGLILIGGNIDLSVAGQAAISTMIFGWLCQKYLSVPWPILMLATLAVAVCFGLINTLLVNKLRFPPFIATIGMSSIYGGLCNVIAQGNNIQITRLSYIRIGKILVAQRFPATFLFALALVIAYQFILSRTPVGRSIFMAGGNQQAARLSGLKPNKIRMGLFINNSVLACIGGLLWSSQIDLASPTSIITDGPDMTVISASILGGISFMGGAGHLIGALIALLLLNTFDNMLKVLQVNDYWVIFAQGFLLAVALIIDYISNERRRKALLSAATASAEKKAA